MPRRARDQKPAVVGAQVDGGMNVIPAPVGLAPPAPAVAHLAAAPMSMMIRHREAAPIPHADLALAGLAWAGLARAGPTRPSAARTNPARMVSIQIWRRIWRSCLIQGPGSRANGRGPRAPRHAGGRPQPRHANRAGFRRAQLTSPRRPTYVPPRRRLVSASRSGPCQGLTRAWAPPLLGDSLAVELAALTRATLVRIQVPQPIFLPSIGPGAASAPKTKPKESVLTLSPWPLIGKTNEGAMATFGIEPLGPSEREQRRDVMAIGRPKSGDVTRPCFTHIGQTHPSPGERILFEADRQEVRH